jgi:hypothetical protein
LGRAALELAAELADGETEVSMLLPRRSYGKAWSRILHDQTADRIVEIVSQLPHVNATIIPFHVAGGFEEVDHDLLTLAEEASATTTPHKKKPAAPTMPSVPGTQPISTLRWRTRARVAGRVKTVRVQTMSDQPTLECVVDDGSGEAITFVFLGRRSIAGLHSGTRIVAEGMVGKHKGRLAIMNPSFELLTAEPSEP